MSKEDIRSWLNSKLDEYNKEHDDINATTYLLSECDGKPCRLYYRHLTAAQWKRLLEVKKSIHCYTHVLDEWEKENG